MKRLSFFLLVLLFVSTTIFSQIIESATYSLVKTFPFGTDKNQLRYEKNKTDRVSPGPIASGFDKKGNYYIFDVWNERVVKYDPKYNFLESIDLKRYNHHLVPNYMEYIVTRLIIEDENIILMAGSTIYYIMKPNGDYVYIDLCLTDYGLDRRSDSALYSGAKCLYYKNIFFITLEDGTIRGIIDPGKDYEENYNKITDLDGLKAYIEKSTDPELKKLSFAELDYNAYSSYDDADYESGYYGKIKKAVIFKDGNIMPISLEAYSEYLYQLSNNSEDSLKTYLDYYKSSLNCFYSGEDKNGRKYWVNHGSGFYVMSTLNGKLDLVIKSIGTINSNPDISITANGDMFFTVCTDKEFQLYRINKEQFVSNGRITEMQVRVRSEPNTESSVLRKVHKDEPIQILSKDSKLVEINGIKSYWYKVKLADSTEGWVFGAYVEETK